MKPYFTDSTGTITIYHCDCREILPSLKADVVVTDPPFGIPIGAAFVRRGGAEVHDGNDPTNATADPYWWLAFVEYVRCAAFFVNRATVCVGERRARFAGLAPWAKFYIVKDAPAPTPRPTFVSAVEECVITERGERVWNGTGYEPNVWNGLTPSRRGVGLHPFEKPLPPIRTLVRCLSLDADTVLDPFIGSGTTLVAAKLEGRRAIGIEIEERYCEIAAKRLAQEVLPFSGVQT